MDSKPAKEEPSIEDQINTFKSLCTVPYEIKKQKVHTKEKLNCPCPTVLIPKSVLRLQKEYETKAINKQEDRPRFVYIRKKLRIYGLLNEPAKTKMTREQYDERYLLKKKNKIILEFQKQRQNEGKELQMSREQMVAKL